MTPGRVRHPFPKRVGAQLAVDGTPPAEPSGFALAYARAAESAGARSKQPSAAYVVEGWDINLLVDLTSLPSKHLTALVNISVVSQRRSLEPISALQPDRGRRLSPAEQVAVLVAYQAGNSMAALAVRYGVRRSTISELLRRGGSPPRVERAISPSEVDNAVHLYAQGLSLVRVGVQLEYNAETIRKQLKRRGVLLRPASGPAARGGPGRSA